MGPSRSCWNGTTSALQPEESTSMCTIDKSTHAKKVWKLIVCSFYIYIYIYIYMSVCVCVFLSNGISIFVGYLMPKLFF